MARAGGRPRAVTGDQLNEGSDSFVRALARGLSILALFDIEHAEWGLNDICVRTKMSKTTAYRMVRTLEATGFLAYDSDTERYHLGRAMIPAAYLAMSYVGFARVARPYLQRLSDATGETVELTVMGPGGAVVVDQVPSKHPFRINLPIGRLQNTTSMSAFRMHLAFLPAAEQRKSLGEGEPTLTPNTMTDPEEIMERMASERAEGLAYDLEEHNLRVCAVSAPVLGPDGHPKAVLTLVAPAERFGVRDRKKKAEAVRSAALKLGNHLNGASSDD